MMLTHLHDPIRSDPIRINRNVQTSEDFTYCDRLITTGNIHTDPTRNGIRIMSCTAIFSLIIRHEMNDPWKCNLASYRSYTTIGLHVRSEYACSFSRVQSQITLYKHS